MSVSELGWMAGWLDHFDRQNSIIIDYVIIYWTSFSRFKSLYVEVGEIFRNGEKVDSNTKNNKILKTTNLTISRASLKVKEKKKILQAFN